LPITTHFRIGSNNNTSIAMSIINIGMKTEAIAYLLKWYDVSAEKIKYIGTLKKFNLICDNLLPLSSLLPPLSLSLPPSPSLPLLLPPLPLPLLSPLSPSRSLFFCVKIDT
jgi:hypothetical protein